MNKSFISLIAVAALSTTALMACGPQNCPQGEAKDPKACGAKAAPQMGDMDRGPKDAPKMDCGCKGKPEMARKAQKRPDGMAFKGYKTRMTERPVHHRPDPKLREILMQLDLSFAQIAELKAQHEAKRKAPRPERPNRAALIAKYMGAEKFDVEGLKAEITAAAQKHIDFKVQNAVEFYNVLTPEQRKKFVDIAKKEAINEGF